MVLVGGGKHVSRWLTTSSTEGETQVASMKPVNVSHSNPSFIILLNVSYRVFNNKSIVPAKLVKSNYPYFRVHYII